MGIIKERHKINKIIRSSKTVFLMAHKNLDLDALGSQLGMYMILKRKKRNCYIILEDYNHEMGVEKVLRELEGCIDIIKGEDIEKYMYPRLSKNALIILDTNKTELVQNQEVLSKIKNKLIIDHHDLGATTIKDAMIIDDPQTSSTCEMITNLIEYYDVEIESYYATILLSGIVLDTNNYTLNTNVETYYSSYYLASLGASARKVQYLLKQDLDDFAERQKLLTDIETIDERIAFTKGPASKQYRREDLAKVADTLLFFNNIEASFVIAKIGKDTIGLSARTLGNYDISKILDKLGGGGDSTSGAATFENTTITKVEENLKKLIKKEGE